MIAKIAATVILYHPDKSCVGNILSYLPYVEKLYVIDNSEKESEIVPEIKKLNKAEYFRNNENIGIAAALNLACGKAMRDGFEWLLTMDQDSMFKSDLFFYAAKTIDDTSDVAIISPNHNNRIAEKDSFEYSLQDMIMTSGNLLNLKLYNRVGNFNDMLFIDEVDHDYCLRARLLDLKIICFTNIILDHKIGETVLKKGRNISVHSPARFYYMTRNTFYLLNKYGRTFPEQIWKRREYLYRDLLNTLRFLDNRSESFRYAYAGFIDYRKHRYGQLQSNRVRKIIFPFQAFFLFWILFFALLFSARPKANP